jgi:hypothetical protein
MRTTTAEVMLLFVGDCHKLVLLDWSRAARLGVRRLRKMQAFPADACIVKQTCVVCPFCPQSSMVVLGNRKQLIKHINSEPGHSSGRDVPPELEMVPAVKSIYESRPRWVRETPILEKALPRYH